jgi:phytoene synthase
MNPEQYVQDKAAASGSSFYYAFLFLPGHRPWRRPHQARLVAAPRSRSPSPARPSHPVMQALMPQRRRLRHPAGAAASVIRGCQMDLEQTRYLDFPGLQRYCHLVAGVVGEVAARIFGQTQPQTTEYAHKLGLAFQLTNIIRDVGEDAMRGRIYLPVNELQQFDVKAHEILQRKHSDRFVALMKFQAQRAHAALRRGAGAAAAEDRRAQKPGLMMASIYRTLLREIEADDFQVLNQRISLTPVRKLWLAWKVQALGASSTCTAWRWTTGSTS